MQSVWRLVKTTLLITLVVLGSVACTDDGLAVRDELTTPSSPNAPDGLAWTIDWVPLDERFTATSAVSVRPDQSMLILDGGTLYRSGENPDTWQAVALLDDQPVCFAETEIGAVAKAITDDATSQLYLELPDGSFAELGREIDASVGCSFAWVVGRLWGTLDDEFLFSMNADGTDLVTVELEGPENPIVGGLTVLSGLEPGVLFVEGTEPGAIDGADAAWSWRVSIGERPATVEGLMRDAGVVTIAMGGPRSEVLMLLGEPGVGFRTTTPLPSKAVLPLGDRDQAGSASSIWQSPRHFVDAGDRIYGFGAFTAAGESEIDSALWSLRRDWSALEGWSEHRGVGPRIDDEPLIAHRVSGHGNRLLVSACALNDADCDEADASTLWLGTITPPDYESRSS